MGKYKILGSRCANPILKYDIKFQDLNNKRYFLIKQNIYDLIIKIWGSHSANHIKNNKYY